MIYLKKLGKSLIYVLSTLLIGTLIITLLNYIFGGTFFKIIKLIVPILSTLIGGYIIGKESKKKGWLEGLKLSLIIIIIFALFNYLGLHNSFSLKVIIYYLIITAFCIIGSMLGISKNETIDK